MTQHYIFATLSPSLAGGKADRKRSIPIAELAAKGSSDARLQPGDRVLVATGRGGNLEMVEPQLYKVAKEDQKSIILEQDRNYSNDVPLERVRAILNRALSVGLNTVSSEEYESIIALMGEVLLEERDLLAHIKDYIAARGYYFSDETVHNYHICLKSRPFVILAGLSGTGKSKLSQLYAEAIGHNVQNGRYLRLAVRPSWNDDRFLLGYLNTITGEYVTEPAIEFVIQAEKNRDNLYFLCLDEMNLAHVEYYFSQFLSALEEENPADRRIYLFSKTTLDRLTAQGKAVDIDRIALVPGNLLFTGTINVDETTQPISDKVIDRANTIEFFEVELAKVPERRPVPDPIHVSTNAWQRYRVDQPDTSYRAKVIEMGQILNKAGLGLGYRVLREIELYLANSRGLLDADTAFDLQVKQRILPRVRGTATIQPTLRDLAKFMRDNRLPRSAARLEEMENRLKRDGYTSFWR
jgi:energy-coupling factor transporter ATP-binding protein EcfA2